MSYSGDPSSNLIDAVRFQVGDTNEDNETVTDMEIQYALTTSTNNVLEAAVMVAQSAAAKYAGLRDRTVGPLSITYSSQFDRWTQLVTSLKATLSYGATGRGTPRGAGVAAEVFGGGKTFLGPDNTPLTYSEGRDTEVTD